MITFNDMWHFLETTFCSEKALHVIGHDGLKLPYDYYIIRGRVEDRFDLEILRDLWKERYTFIVQSSSITRELTALVDEIEEDNNVEAGAHIYAGLKNSRSFNPHADNPDNLIIQCIGESQVTLYSDEGLTVKDQFILRPGGSVYIPSKQYHLVEPLTDRLSISIPIYKNEKSSL